VDELAREASGRGGSGIGGLANKERKWSNDTRSEVSTTAIGETRIDAVSTAPTTVPSPLFSVKDLQVSVTTEDAAKEAANGALHILRGVNLTINAGEVHAIMGPNGSGKSTLANALMASEEYTVDSGSVSFKGTDISDWETDARAKAGMFLAFQYPEEIPGVTVINFMRQALSARKGIDLSTLELRLSIMEWMGRLGMDPDFANRYLNEGFSGGEKKRNEVLQMAILEPDFAILDETDSGLDIDALQIVAKGVHEVRKSRPQLGVLMITHYQRLLELIEPDHVHIMIDGRIVESGGMELVHRLEADGYDAWKAA
jgi:Fe-S cluster assembly ATP-binding protein